MAKQLTEKTFKVEIEITVGMYEIPSEPCDPDGQDTRTAALADLQQALLSDEPALRQQMLTAATCQLQDYWDYLTGQDSLALLRALADHLETSDEASFGLTPPEFLDATRLLRIDSQMAQVTASRILEKAPGEDECAAWQPVWSDLRPGTEFGRQLAALKGLTPPIQLASPEKAGHYYQITYVTRQPDGVHVQGHCSCGRLIEGLGEDEGQALAVAWKKFQEHASLMRIGEKMDLAVNGPITRHSQ